MKVLFILLVFFSLVPLTFAKSNHGTYYGAQQVEHPDWFKNSFLELGEDVKEATANNKRILLYFYQKGCPYCAKLVSYNFSQKEILEKTKSNFDLIAINMWGDAEVIAPNGKAFSEKSFSSHLQIQFTPTLLFLDESGKIILRLNGYQPPHKFSIALDYVSGKLETQYSFSEFLVQNLSRKTSGKLISESFFELPPFALVRNRFSAKKPLAVFFEQTECPACVDFHQQVLQQPEVLQRINKMQVVQLDRWSSVPVLTPSGKKTTSRKWADELKLTYSPAVVFFDNKGKEVMRIDGYLKHFHTWGVLEYVLSKAYLKQPSFQRFLSDYADQQLLKGLDVNIWN